MIFLSIHLAKLVECTIVLSYVVLFQVLDGLGVRHASEWLFRSFEFLEIITFVYFVQQATFVLKQCGHSLG